MSRRVIDWVPIREKYLAGIGPTIIGKAHGVSAAAICAQAQRKQWKQQHRMSQRTAARQKAIETHFNDNVKKVSNDETNAFLKIFTEDVLHKLDLYTTGMEQPANHKEALVYESVMEKLNVRARKTFGLDQQTSATQHTTVNVRVLSDSAAIQVNTNGEQRPAVDVESVTTPGQIEDQRAKP